LELSLGDSGIVFEPGDAFGILPENCPEYVTATELIWEPPKMQPLGLQLADPKTGMIDEKYVSRISFLANFSTNRMCAA
jgi:sulfite reductase alpha subunit-like flavoprotein